MAKEFIFPLPAFETLHLTLSLKEEEPKSYKCYRSIGRLRFSIGAYLEPRISGLAIQILYGGDKGPMGEGGLARDARKD